METSIEVFTTYDEAFNRMLLTNLAAGDNSPVVCLVEHPDGWAVCDIQTAIDTGLQYEWHV